ncbi:MAG TPA: PIN domain-containing protein [Aggregatilineales bacterium]|nr:PIN domain-containing protein [Aggregatilineales bacterium]
MPDLLVDASYLVALGYPRDRHHTKATMFANEHETGLLIPDVVLAETIYNLQRLGGIAATVQFSRLLLAHLPQFVPLTVTDFARGITLMDKYRDAELDFVDCCLTALAERLGITGICTFDRRDFSMIQPKHTDYFDLLP